MTFTNEQCEQACNDHPECTAYNHAFPKGMCCLFKSTTYVDAQCGDPTSKCFVQNGFQAVRNVGGHEVGKAYIPRPLVYHQGNDLGAANPFVTIEDCEAL